MADFDPNKTPGTFGAPPPGAPRQTADNVNIQATAEQVAMARKFERELAPLTFKDSVAPPERPAVPAVTGAPVLFDPSGQLVSSAPPATVVGIPGTTTNPNPAPAVVSSFRPPDRPLRRSRFAAIAKPIEQVAAEAAQHANTHDDDGAVDSGTVPADLGGADGVDHALDVEQSSAPPGGAEGADAAPAAGDAAGARQVVDPVAVADVVAAGELPDVAPEQRERRVLTEADLRAADPVVPRRPAASDTDSPSRGVPRPITDPGKKITGGFGDLGEAQYFPLDGLELREVVFGLMDKIYERLKDDLRFTIAATYPRVAARVVVEIDGFAQDSSFQVQAVMPPHTKTPIDVARDHGDQIVFVVIADHVEMTADGESITPPNTARRALGLEVPFKRAVPVGSGGTGGRLYVDREG